MPSQVLSQMEKRINHLSGKEQLWLIELLAHRLRENSIKSSIEKSAFESQLSAMAMDTEVRVELQKIGQEFAVAEADGLESR
ncbi:MAG: hypothetical protein QME42_06985 [bacterium]|nr:hypothetical protein [bacterium]